MDKMLKPKGGRGKKNDYDSRTVRCPEPILPLIQDLIQAWHDKQLDENITCHKFLQVTETNTKTKEEVEAAIQKTLKAKKSAKESLALLIKILYG